MHIQLSCDGIQETKSTTVAIDVYSLCFKHCKCIYPIKLIRPLNKQSVDKRKQLKEVLTDIRNNDLRILQYIADKIKRSEAKECKSHAAWYACEYCYGKGVKIMLKGNVKAKEKIEQQISIIDQNIAQFESEPATPERDNQIQNLVSLKNELKSSLSAFNRKSNILWPFSTMYAQNRSRNSILEIVNRIERQEHLTIDQSKGIMGRSLLLDIPDFNFIYDSPAEYLHSGCLGVIKRLTELTFACGSTRQRVTKRKLSSPAAFNKLMLCTKVPHEFPRRARALDFSVFKGQEFRNLGLFFFPLVIECIQPGSKEITLWLLMAYMLRSSVIPSNEFSEIDIPLVHNCCEKFYQLFEQLFGKQNCVYNLHAFVGHLMEIRTHGPLTETSAFKFEAFYGEIRRSFQPGTTSPLKQIMKNILLKRTLSNHQCKNNILISNYNTSLECNNLIYCYRNKEYLVYEVKDIDENIVTCHKVGQYQAQFKETPNIPWSKVGVFKKGGVSSDETIVPKSEIDGKVLHVGKFLITCPHNVLNEK